MITLRKNYQVVRDLINIPFIHAELVIMLTKREIRDRYIGNMLGIFWSIGYPLIQIGVYFFIFTSVFKLRYGTEGAVGPLYLLTGIIPWLAVQESIIKGCYIILNDTGLVKQIVFPIEILPLKSVLATLFTESIFVGVLLIYMLSMGMQITLNLLLLPIFFLLQGFFMLGFAYALSAITVYFRDMKELVGIATLFGIFTLPVVFSPSSVPEFLKWVIYLNPISYMIDCNRYIWGATTFADGTSWVIFTGTSIFSLILGYRIFGKLRITFGSVL